MDGFYSTYKLALLLHNSRLIDEFIAYRWRLEILWSLQREDSGVRSHYLGNLTSKRKANSETASLILIAYNYGFSKPFEVVFKNSHSDALRDPHIEERKASFANDEARTSYLMAKKQYDDAVQYLEARVFELAVMYAQDAYSNHRHH